MCPCRAEKEERGAYVLGGETCLHLEAQRHVLWRQSLDRAVLVYVAAREVRAECRADVEGGGEDLGDVAFAGEGDGFWGEN